MSRIVCVDFDGTIAPDPAAHGLIPDLSVPPNDGAEAFLRTLQGRGFEVVILSSRATIREGQIGIKTYLRRWNLTGLISDVTGTKVSATAYVDNRAVAFKDNNWQQCLLDVLRLSAGG